MPQYLLARGILALVFVVNAAGQSNFICPGVKTILDKPEELEKMTLRNTACLKGDSEQCQPIAPAYCSPKDRCLMAPCLHGATCHTAPEHTYYCSCPPLYTGENCETFDSCMSMPCLNSGTCITDCGGDFICSCPTSYTGLMCETLDPCLTTPCQNGGTCTASADGSSYSCSCVTLVTGVNCETGPEWISNGGRSYYSSTTQCTYTECRAICQNLGADLITIESAEEQTFAESIITHGDNFWLSIYETTGTLPGTWVVNQDSSQEIAYTNWYSTQPDSASARCAAASSGWGYQWYDGSCTANTLYYICEK